MMEIPAMQRRWIRFVMIHLQRSLIRVKDIRQQPGISLETSLIEKAHFRQVIFNLRENTQYSMSGCRAQSVFEQSAQDLVSRHISIGHRGEIRQVPGDTRRTLAHLGKAQQTPM